MGEVNIGELQQALIRLREQNRSAATENMIITEELRLVELRTEKLMKVFEARRLTVQEETERQQMQMDTEVKEIVKKRRDRRRALVRQIREKTGENERIENEIRLIESELTKMRKLKETFPKDLTRKIRLSTKRAQINHNPQSPIRV